MFASKRSALLLTILTPFLVPTRTDEISKHILTKSVLHYGDPAILGLVLQRLRDDKCIHACVIGGSVSAGRGLPNGTFAYPALFEQALNTAFPCKGRHTVTTFVKGGVTSDFWLEYFVGRQEILLRGIDLIIVDTAVNDLADITPGGGTSVAPATTNAELLMAMLLQRPNRVVDGWSTAPPAGAAGYARAWTSAAVLYLGTATHLLGPDWNETIWRGLVPRSTDAVFAQLPAAIAQGVPYISIIDGLGPFSTPEAAGWFRQVWCSADFHPGPWGHEALAQALVHFLAVQQASRQELPWHDPKLPRYRPRPPTFVRQATLDMYLDAAPLRVEMAETLGRGWHRSHCAGWHINSTNPGKVILEGRTVGTSCTLFADAQLLGRTRVQQGEVHLALVRSYANHGLFSVLVAAVPSVPDDDQGGGSDGKRVCSLGSQDALVLGSREVDGSWDKPISVTRVEVFPMQVPPSGGTECLIFTFEVLPSARPDNYVRIRGLTVY